MWLVRTSHVVLMPHIYIKYDKLTVKYVASAARGAHPVCIAYPRCSTSIQGPQLIDSEQRELILNTVKCQQYSAGNNRSIIVYIELHNYGCRQLKHAAVSNGIVYGVPQSKAQCNQCQQQLHSIMDRILTVIGEDVYVCCMPLKALCLVYRSMLQHRAPWWHWLHAIVCDLGSLIGPDPPLPWCRHSNRMFFIFRRNINMNCPTRIQSRDRTVVWRNVRNMPPSSFRHVVWTISGSCILYSLSSFMSA